MNGLVEVGYRLLDRGLIPDFLLRVAIRMLLRQRLREIDAGSFEANHTAKMKWIEDVRTRPSIAEVPEKANEQHYEVSTDFILSTLGPYGKYSSCLYPTGRETLAEAEKLMLESYCSKARLKDGLDVLDLGCGWGSLSLFLAEKYPNSRITGLSNSATQKQHIDATARSRSIINLEIINADVNTHDFDVTKLFDRILSIEMFEHMKNYQQLFKKVSTWLRPKHEKSESLAENDYSEGADESMLFVHIFCHRTTPYHFVQDDGWMAKNFFSGGTMPSHDLFSDLVLLRTWYLPGTHYSRTCEDWIRMQDRNGKKGMKTLEVDAVQKGLPPMEGRKAYNRFRVFYIACSELFKMDGGNQWGVGHYLFKAR